MGVYKSELTLEDHIASKRRKLVEARMEVPMLRAHVAKMRDEAATMAARYEQRRARDVTRVALALEHEANERESMSREHEFERTVVTYLRTYHSRAQPQPQTTAVSTHLDMQLHSAPHVEGGEDEDDDTRSSACRDRTREPHLPEGLRSSAGARVPQGQQRLGSATPSPAAGGGIAAAAAAAAATEADENEEYYTLKRKNKSKSETIEAYVKQTDATNARRVAIVEEYLTHVHSASPRVAMAVRDECVRCVGIKLLLCSSKSIMTCPECGYSVTYLDATSSSTSFDDVVEFSQYSYKRVNHFLMWLALVQGKEVHRVADDVVEAVMTDLYYRQHASSVTDVTQKKVREALRRLRLRRAYDHVAQITARISGAQPPRISAEVEEQLKNMFLQMQPAFHKHTAKCRKNFLSYPYVLYRCFQILGLHHMLEGITLLKGRDKLEANDAIFRKMCDTLGWHVADLPPASETTSAF